MSYPYFKFYPRDFLGHPTLQRCPRAVRAVLVELICLAHEQVTYGVLRAGDLAGYLAGDPEAQSAVAILLEKGILNKVPGSDDILLRRITREKQSREDGRAARLKRGDLAGMSRAGARVPEARSQIKNPPPPEGGETSRKRSRRRSDESWEVVLERSEYSALRESSPFKTAIGSWVAWTQTVGAKARTPHGPQAAAMFNEALRVGPELYAAAIERAIASNWQGVHVDAVTRANGHSLFERDVQAQSERDELIEKARSASGRRP